ncbi:hypothetical protein [Aporhodopirellula aestuarii]|uniref:Uncharacterized protein n=1 Tax=Aporhodopirellula aestuarii TaxID=2950107 RepID=A0ABT0U7X3_9BACT|nr:hypothetical protein [Aporhodopirellula aestuarii]MCM2372518.1 hypothetical protein [Aporhodopirellula aestuarii]
MVAHASDTDFFRCPITVENSSAILRIRRRRVAVHLQEASIDGYTILVRALHSSQLRIGEPWVLLHNGATIEVQAQWFFQAADGQVQIGLRRLRDLTRPPVIGGWLPSIFGTPKSPDYSSSSLVLSCGVLGVLLALALPGLGDLLGTSKPIQAAINSVYGGLRSVMKDFL